MLLRIHLAFSLVGLVAVLQVFRVPGFSRPGGLIANPESLVDKVDDMDRAGGSRKIPDTGRGQGKACAKIIFISLNMVPHGPPRSGWANFHSSVFMAWFLIPLLPAS